MPAPMVVHLSFILGTEMCQLHGARVPGVLDSINVHRRYVDLEAAWEPGVVQPVHIGWLQRRWQAKWIVVAGHLYLVAERVGLVPETALHGLPQIAGLHEGFNLLACSAGLFMQLFACGVVDFPGGGRDRQAHVRKDIKGYAAANEDGGFEGERLFGVFVVVVEDEGGNDGTALGEAEDGVVWFPLLAYV